MVSTLDPNHLEPSFQRLEDYSSDSSSINQSSNTNNNTNFYAATTPNTSSSDYNKKRAPLIAAKPPRPPKYRKINNEKQRIEKPIVTNVTVRPYSESMASMNYARRSTSPPQAILGRLSESSIVERQPEVMTSSEDDREFRPSTSPLPAIIRDKVSIGAPFR